MKRRAMRASGPRGIVVALLTILLCGGAFLATAQAYNVASYWNGSNNPLVKSGYDSTARAYGYITINNGSNGTRLYSHAWNKFTDGDNHSAYIHAIAQFNAGTCRSSSSTTRYKGVSVASSASCHQKFYDHTTFRSDGLNYTRNVWTKMTNKNTSVNENADQGRALVMLCIDVPWRVDPCTGRSHSASDSW